MNKTKLEKVRIGLLLLKNMDVGNREKFELFFLIHRCSLQQQISLFQFLNSHIISGLKEEERQLPFDSRSKLCLAST